MSAQEKEALFRLVLCQHSHFEGLNDGFHFKAEEEELHLATVEQSLSLPPSSAVQEAGADKLDDKCAICRMHPSSHGRIVMLVNCGHVYGEKCFRESLVDTPPLACKVLPHLPPDLVPSSPFCEHKYL